MIIQGSDAWFALRLGQVTASRIADVSAKTRSGGWGATRATYMAQLIAERLTGERAEGYKNAAMQWGTDTEPEARAAYAFRADLDVAEIGYVPHPTIAMSGASPDGLVAPDGLVEFKCPNTSTHIETLISGKVDYHAQMYWQMACTERAWCDYVSYDPRLPEHMRLFVRRVPRDDAKIAQLEKDVIEFLAELDDKINNLNRLYARDLSIAA